MMAKLGGTFVFAFIASLVILIAIGVVSYRSVQTLVANNELVDHTQEVLDQLQDIRIEPVDFFSPEIASTSRHMIATARTYRKRSRS